MQFPLNPVTGDTFTSHDVTYLYTGDRWTSGWKNYFGDQSKIVAQPTVPATPENYDLWFDTINDVLKKYDTTTSQWSVVGAPSGPPGMKVSLVVPANRLSISFKYSKIYYTAVDDPAITERSVTIDWGDGTTADTYTSANATLVTVSHTFAEAGTYILSLDGSGCVQFGGPGGNLVGMAMDVLDWDGFTHTTMYATFWNINIPTAFAATNTPTFTSYANSNCGMYSPFAQTYFNDPRILDWDFSKIKSLKYAFASTVKFNQPLNSISVGHINDFNGAFLGALEFNQPLNSWDVSSGRDFVNMFSAARLFNSSLEGWSFGKPASPVSGAAMFQNMFGQYNTVMAFNQDLSTWDMSNVIGWCRGIGSAPGWIKPRPPAGTWQEKGFKGSDYANYNNGQWSQSAFVMKIVTTTANQSTQILFRENTTNNIYYQIVWGDGSAAQDGVTTASASDFTLFHTFVTPGTYYVQFIGFPGVIKPFNTCTEIVQWGLGKRLDYRNTFQYNTAIAVTATDQPRFYTHSSAKYAESMFYNWKGNNVQGIENWNMSMIPNTLGMTSMFQLASNFNQDLSKWCVTNISTKPSNFDTGATAWTQPKPIWGTCP